MENFAVRYRVSFVLFALTLAALVFAAVLLNHGSHHTLQGVQSDAVDSHGLAQETSVRVACVSPAHGGGTQLSDSDASDEVAEDDGYTLSQLGVNSSTAGDVCGRIRTSQVSHAVELGFLGLLLGGWGVLNTRQVTRNARPRPVTRAEDDGAAL